MTKRAALAGIRLIFAAVMFIIGAVLLLRGAELGPMGQVLRCSSVVCMALVGIVFNTLLRDVDLGSLLPWINVLLHYVMPVVVVADWLVQSPPRPVRFRNLWIAVLIPVAYLAYSLVRGAAINWYPYPFLNPGASGYGAVTVTCLGIAVVFIVVSAALVGLANRLRPLVRRVAGHAANSVVTERRLQ
ncbi:Pr6Pr family membrane protein [Specibacter cremeus]|uniref:Pr6Pr family membrane protein n=1 Tax=Specibacter cremeus TaxID=1629051 RepID=UPI000F795C93|nr:Pr6Pr family membrane protein [Specibacter cremeus]